MPIATHLALNPRSTCHRRRPRARPTVRPAWPLASRSTPSSSRRPGGRTPLPQAPPRHPPILALRPLSSRSLPRSSRRPRTPQSNNRPCVPLTSSLILANLRPCYRRGSIVVLPLLSDLLLSGLRRRPPAAAGHADTRDPSPGSLRCCRTCCRDSISFELRPSRSQPSPCLEIKDAKKTTNVPGGEGT
ncbi:uncharacterized protein LOC119276916 [Triticum dicoccoides]|uniref:uncharacterized protein LOC119276916 n=1 Tax=Triticum dicoccoides TaxID=85692 RepID=UPI00188EC82E|nr:uncharacterized protein LOC119276916 [Triticum dicoccoides]